MIRPLQEEVRSHLRSGVAITNLTQCVEELVLNSLDAGASNITVRIDVPNFKVQVSDNGNGIAFGDLRLVGERYSSSKCHVLKDLEQLNFYGFRGEALASVREICDVLEIVTRHRASYQTFCKLFRNSQVLELAESRFPRTSSGTTVTIHNIFTNLPVRRKSISETLDFERVRHRIASIALIHPNTAFLLINDSTGAKCLQTHVCKSSVSTFSQLFGNQRSKGLQQAQFEHKNFKVSGFISTDTHHSKSLQFLFVNGRLLLKTRIHKLVNSILGKSELLKKCAASEIDSTSTQGYPSKTTSPQNIKTIDKHGIFVLNIDCLVTEYDICLEPAKTLIEFQDWDSVLYCVQRCVEEFLFKYDLISCSEQSPKSTESRADEGNSVFVERFCHTSLEAFEYKREIETSNVKKSLHSSIVFRPKKAEEGDAVSQNKVPSLERGLSSPSNSLLSHQKHDSNDGDDTVSFTVSSCSNSNSLPKAVSLSCVEKLTPCLDLTSNVGKLPLSCTNKIGDEPLDGNHGSQINYTTTCHKSNTADSSIVTVSSSVKAAVRTLPVSRHCVCSDLQKTSACQCKGNGLSNIQRSLFNKLSKNCRNNTVALSASPESRKACDSAVSLDKEGDLRTHHHLSDHEQIPCPANTGSFQQSSVAKPRSTETSNVAVNTSRSKAMPTFTSPCPITLQRVYTRKRPQSNKETASSGPGLAPKNRRIITLQGSCNRRARYDRDSAGHFSSRKDSECKAHNTHVVCCDQIVQKLADNSCNPKLSTSSVSGIVPGTHVHNYPDNLCVTTMNNTGMNSYDSNSGLPALFRDTCDAAVAFDCNQPDTSYPIEQVGSSSLHNKQTQPVERNIVNFAEVPYLNGTEQEGVLHKCTESWHQPQKESAVAERGVSTDQSSEFSLEPSSGAGKRAASGHFSK